MNQIEWYNKDGSPRNTWTCSQTGCTVCEGHYCIRYFLKVSSVGAEPDNLPSVTDCKYGDTVKLEGPSGDGFAVREIAIIGKQGEITHWLFYV